MYWSDILDQIQTLSGIKILPTGKFTPSSVRLIASSIQGEISHEAQCQEGYITFSTVAGTREYDLPKDIDLITAVQVGSFPRLGQCEIIPIFTTALSGQPRAFYRYGKKIGFDIIPSAVETVKMWFTRTTPIYAMNVWYSAAAADADSAALEVTDTGITLSRVKGSTTTTATFAFSTYTTIGALVAAINAPTTGPVASKWTAVQSPECGDDLLSSDLEQRAAVNIYFPGDSTLPSTTDAVGETKPRLYFNPQIPDNAHGIIINGTVEIMKFGDREITPAQYQGMEYKKQIKAFADQWNRRNSSAAPQQIRDGLGLRGRGRGGTYVGPGGIPTIFIS